MEVSSAIFSEGDERKKNAVASKSAAQVRHVSSPSTTARLFVTLVERFDIEPFPDFSAK